MSLTSPTLVSATPHAPGATRESAEAPLQVVVSEVRSETHAALLAALEESYRSDNPNGPDWSVVLAALSRINPATRTSYLDCLLDHGEALPARFAPVIDSYGNLRIPDPSAQIQPETFGLNYSAAWQVLRRSGMSPISLGALRGLGSRGLLRAGGGAQSTWLATEDHGGPRDEVLLASISPDEAAHPPRYERDSTTASNLGAMGEFIIPLAA